MRIEGEGIPPCPHARDRRIILCTHCDPEEAPCALACKKGAIYEIGYGILAIDEEKCDGCGACAEACPQGAIVIVNGKARKCDFCISLETSPKCLEAGFRIVYSEEEERRRKKNLGWGVLERAELENPSLLESEIVKRVRELYDGRKSVEEILAEIEAEANLLLPEERKKNLLRFLRWDLEGYGPFTPLLTLENEEIAFIGLEKPIYIYKREKGWEKTPYTFFTLERFVEVINKLALETKRRLTLKNPRLNAVLPDGSRLHATIPPASSEPSATIRIFAKKPFALPDLVSFGTFPAELAGFFWAAMLTDSSIIVAGNTGSGKTTTLNALLLCVPLNERIVLVEETPEIRLPHPHVVRLMTVDYLGIGMHELIWDTLRMRPDRVVVGEVRRREEVLALMDSMLAGQGKGVYSTIHGKSARDVMGRMRAMGVNSQDLEAIDLIVVQKRWSLLRKGRFVLVRKVTEVFEPSTGKVLWNGRTLNLLGSWIAEKIEQTFDCEVQAVIDFLARGIEDCKGRFWEWAPNYLKELERLEQ